MTDQPRGANDPASGGNAPDRTSRAAATDGQDPMSIADLTFEHQIVIWAMRMFLQGSDAFLKVRDEFNRALPPAAGRIAFTAVERMIGTLRRYGRRNLRFSCLCNTLLTRDEISVLVLLISLEGDDYHDMVKRARELVLDDGTHMLIDAAAILMSALASRHADRPERLPLCVGEATLH